MITSQITAPTNGTRTHGDLTTRMDLRSHARPQKAIAAAKAARHTTLISIVPPLSAAIHPE
jgi:hypothetical protein